MRSRSVVTGILAIGLAASLTVPAGAVTSTGGDAQVDAAVAALDGIVRDVMTRTGLPGMSVSVVHDGVQVYGKGFGVADVDTGAPVDADTAFQLASVSKTIGASVIAAVMGTTDITWTDPVSDYLPYFRLSDPYVTEHATIGDMYAMRSGLPHQAGDDIAELGYTRRQIIERLGLLPLVPFRAKHLYANYSVTIGAEAVATEVGVPWEQLSAQRLYVPMGMSRTTSVLSEFRAMPNHATLHVKSGEKWFTNGTRDEQAQSPAGMVSSSANDMARWMIMELANGAYGGRQIVDAQALQQTRVPRSLTTPNRDPGLRPGFYGYGTSVRTDETGRVRWQHSGAFSQGAATTFQLLPSENLGITVLTNAYPIGAAEAVADAFIDLVENGRPTADWLKVNGDLFAAALGAGTATATPPANPRPSGDLSQYVGTYANAYYGPVVVRKDGRGLVATLGPAKAELPLLPYDGTTFGMPDASGGVTPVAQFAVRDGRATSVQFAFLNAPGFSSFTRSAATG